MDGYSIYALKVEDMASTVYESLLAGEGRFGWSYVPTADLRQLKSRIEKSGWEGLSEDEKKCYQPFLLDFKQGDFVVYVNVPEWGKCTVARVTGEYYFKWDGDGSDFNHRFPADPKSVFQFSRNSESVPPKLRTRLKLQGRKWRISAISEFEELLNKWKSGTLSDAGYTAETDRSFLSRELAPLLSRMTRVIHETHPKTALEGLIAEVIKRIPGVIKDSVKLQGGRGDHGADIRFEYEESIPFPELGLGRPRKVVVQVKSFEGEHWDDTAVRDIERALQEYQADYGLIVSSADKSGEVLDRQLEELTTRIGKPIGLIIGQDLARFILKYGQDLIPRAI